MNAAESFLLTYLLNSAWQTPLWFAAASAVAYLLRRQSPIALHRVWVGALLLQVLFPAVAALPVPRWMWRSAGSSEGVTVSFGPSVVQSGHAGPGELFAGVAVLYAATILFFAARLLWGWRKTDLLLKNTLPAALNVEQGLIRERCCVRFHLREAAIEESSEISTPFTWGALRRRIVLPAGLLQRLPPCELEALLAHECAHMARHDFALNLLYEVLLLPCAFHPFAHMTRSRLVESREWVCDAMAAQALSSARGYARSLLRLATLLLEARPAPVPHAIGVLDANALERRITQMMQPMQKVSVARRAGMVLACGVLGLVTAGSAWALRTGISLPVAPQEAPAPGPRVIRISGGVMAGNKVGGPNPVYPADVRAAGIQGTVVLKATISADGKIEDLQVASGPQELRQSALDAVSQWMYRPYLLNGEPTAVQTTITVNYNLNP